MATRIVRIQLQMAWWIWPYLHTLGFLCKLIGTEPDWDHVEYWVNRSIKVVPVPVVD